MLTIRTPDGTTRKLCRHYPPLRLRSVCSSSSNTNNVIAATLPADVIQRILFFLQNKSCDWLTADSCCVAWREAACPLWKGQRQSIAALWVASQRIQRTWNKLYGFLPLENIQQSLNGPATQDELDRLQEAVLPWTLPPVFIASLQIHNGERDRGLYQSGIYMGSRLLSIQEIMDTCSEWRIQAEAIEQTLLQDGIAIAANTTASRILWVPLFSQAGARQVAMELHLHPKYTPNDQLLFHVNHHHHGRIVMISSTTPFAPHYKNLAGSWDGFLTLI